MDGQQREQATHLVAERFVMSDQQLPQSDPGTNDEIVPPRSGSVSPPDAARSSLGQVVEAQFPPSLDLAVPVLPGMEAALDPLSEAQIRSERARRVFEVEEQAGPWLDDYWALISGGWTWRQAVYMIWEAQPPRSRTPKTQSELATMVLGLTSDRMISKWKQDNPAMSARIAKLTVSALAKARAQVIAALAESAKSSNPRSHADRRMFLEMTGDYVPRQKVDFGAVLPDDLSEMDSDDLRAVINVPAVESGDDGD